MTSLRAASATRPRCRRCRRSETGATTASRSRRSYDVGEYDVSILSAEQSDGLVTWLTDNGYRIPAGAEAVLGSYIKQNMRFFVAKVNLDRMEQIGHGLPAAAAGALRDRRNSCCRCGSAP